MTFILKDVGTRDADVSKIGAIAIHHDAHNNSPRHQKRKQFHSIENDSGSWERLGAVLVRVLERTQDEMLPTDGHWLGSSGEAPHA